MKKMLCLIIVFALAACSPPPEPPAPPAPQLTAAPLGAQVGDWRTVTSDVLRLTVKAPGATRVRLFYQPFAAVGQRAELKSFLAAPKQNEFVYEWPAGPDLVGKVWAEASYADGAQKQTEMLTLAHEAAIRAQTGDAPLDSVGGSIQSDETATDDKFTRGKIEHAAFKPGDARLWLTVNLPAFQLTVWQNGKEVKSYDIGIGRKDFPVPVGARRASEIIWNPAWIPPDSAWVTDDVEPFERIEADDPRNPLGKIKIRLGDAILIHEAVKPSDIGALVSHGCVRMRTADLYELTEMIVAARGLPITQEQIEQTKTKTERLAVELNPPLWVDINYDTAVIEGRTLRLYPDVYDREQDALAKLREELQAAGIGSEQLDEATLRQMRERVSRTEAFVVSLEDLRQGRALSAGRTEPLWQKAEPARASSAAPTIRLRP